MSQLQEKTSLFTKAEIHGVDYAQAMYNEESAKFKFKLICAIISLLSPLSLLISVLFGDAGFLTVLETVLVCIACGATLIANPIVSAKTILKFGVIGYLIVPFIIINIIGFIFGIFLALFVFIAFPTFYCIIGLIQSYRNKKDAKEYLEMFNN